MSTGLNILNTTLQCIRQNYHDKKLITDLVRLLRHTEELVPHLHLHDGPSHGRHGAQDVQFLALIQEDTAVGLLTHKTLRLFVVIHLFVQTLVARFATVVDAHGHPVLVHVVVERHREHYGQFLFDAFPSLIEVVGHDAHCTGG